MFSWLKFGSVGLKFDVETYILGVVVSTVGAVNSTVVVVVVLGFAVVVVDGTVGAVGDSGTDSSFSVLTVGSSKTGA